MGEFYFMKEESDRLVEQMDDVKKTSKDLLNLENKKWELTPHGRKSMNADAYVSGKISLDEFVRREQEAEFSISKDDFDKLPLAEQNKLYQEHPDKIRKLLGK